MWLIWEDGGAPVRIGLLTEGGYPYASGESHAWCDRLVRGLTGHDFEVYALSAEPRRDAPPRPELPRHVRLVHSAPLGSGFPAGRRLAGEPRRGRTPGRRERRRFAECFGALVAAFATAPPGESRPPLWSTPGAPPTGERRPGVRPPSRAVPPSTS